MHIRRWILVAALSLATAGSAAAQDTANWSGWYGGGYGGYIFGKLTSNDPSHFTTTGEFDDNGATAGIYVGRRTQSANDMVLGFELVLPLFTETGSAVDTVFFPGLVRYEGDPKLGAFIGVHAGKATGKMLPLVFAEAGFMSAEGRTLNVDENDQYSPGFVQKASASHFVWKLGAGLDYRMGTNWMLGARGAYMKVGKADHTMSWNTPGPNEFGLNCTQLQVNVGRQF